MGPAPRSVEEGEGVTGALGPVGCSTDVSTDSTKCEILAAAFISYARRLLPAPRASDGATLKGP